MHPVNSNEVRKGNDDFPLVSVIIPAYRAAGFIEAAIKSVFDQTFKDYEVILINDGSPDTTPMETVLRPYLNAITYLKRTNGGPAAARNTGLGVARGEFVAFLDADDYWKPRFLEKQIDLIKRNPGTDLVYCDALIVGDTALAGRTFMQTNPSRGEVTFESLLDGRCMIVLSGVVARRQSVVAAGMFDERLRLSEDYDLWLRMARSGARMGYQKKVLLCHRDNPRGLAADPTLLFESALGVLDRTQRENEMTDRERSAVLRHSAKLRAYIRLESGKRDLERGHFSAAAAAFEEANQFYHSWKLRLVLLWLRISPKLLLRTYNALRPVNPVKESIIE